MASILERLRNALRPEYEVERELGQGGMGLVFLAHEATLDRPVAIKILRPEYATAEAAERFLREARILASLSHPNVVGIHRAGERDGLFFYAMDRLEGLTLHDQLASGPLSRPEILKLGRDLLDALEAVHTRGVIHRDIKPSNVFLIEGRAVLTDFGIAHPSGDRSRVAPGETAPAGTPGYMPPEQANGWDLTTRTDLYAVAMVLYEAYTGRRWVAVLPDAHADWSGVPRAVIPILKRALAWHPDDRWSDAARFRRALWRTRTRRYVRRTQLLTAAGVVAGATLAYVVFSSRDIGTGFADLALLPLEVRGTTDSLLGADLARVAGLNLEAFLDLIPQAGVLSWWDTARARAAASDAPRELRARHVAHGSVEVVGDSLIVRVSVTDSSGRVHPAGEVVRAASEPLTSLGYRLGFQIGRVVAPDNYMNEYRASRALAGKDNEAVREFLAGERAFHRNAWSVAARHYRRAAQLDTTFLVAWFRYHYATYWASPGSLPSGPTLATLYTAHGDDAGELDRLLIRARIAATPAERYQLYETAIEQFPRDGFVDFLYADELYHRGALTGIPRDSALPLLLTAVTKTPSLAPAWDHLVQLLIERDHADSARWALDALRQVSAPPHEAGMDLPRIWEVVFGWRFGDGSHSSVPDDLLAQPIFLVQFRRANGLGLSEQQAEVGAIVAGDHRAHPSLRAIGATGRAVALFTLGRIADALVSFDSAAAWFGSPEAHLHAAAWRVIPAALGVPGASQEDRRQGREQLEQLITQSVYVTRAAWALAVDAYSRGDTAGARRWKAVVRHRDPRLTLQLEAMDEAAAGRPHLALERSAPALAYDSGATGGDPFARAVLHLRRAAWYDELGRWRDADRERLWYENVDVTAQFDGVPLSSEVDWALRPYAALLRARSALDRGDQRAGCRLARPVLDAWARSDSALRLRVRALRDRLPPECAA